MTVNSEAVSLPNHEKGNNNPMRNEMLLSHNIVSVITIKLLFMF